MNLESVPGLQNFPVFSSACGPQMPYSAEKREAACLMTSWVMEAAGRVSNARGGDISNDGDGVA